MRLILEYFAALIECLKFVANYYNKKHKKLIKPNLTAKPKPQNRNREADF